MISNINSEDNSNNYYYYYPVRWNILTSGTKYSYTEKDVILILTRTQHLWNIYETFVEIPIHLYPQ